MIVPMKKISVIMLEGTKEQALKKLRKLGLMHIDSMQGSGEKLMHLTEQMTLLKKAVSIADSRSNGKTEQVSIDPSEALSISERIDGLSKETEVKRSELTVLQNELERIRSWGDIDPIGITELEKHGVKVALYDMPPGIYKYAKEEASTLLFSRDKYSVRLLIIDADTETEEKYSHYKVELPEISTSNIKKSMSDIKARMDEIEKELDSCSAFTDSMKDAVKKLKKDIELETVSSGIDSTSLSDSEENRYSISYFTGYIEADELDRFKEAAKENSWGVIAEDPTPEDNVPTKLKNNRFVSLIYPLTNFLGTVPGYFEYDISGWFLGFILIFFGIIFGDGGYGLLICFIAAIPIIKSLVSKKPVQPAFLLILLLGGATVLWGVLTCTWFGISPEYLPVWLQKLSVPIFSNVNADKLWYPPWTNGEAALTTTQNVQIFCFALAFIQLTVAHIKGMIRNRRSLNMLGDLGSALLLIGIFYIVLSLVVNGAVFGFDTVIGGIPIGTVAIACIAVGFLINFIFANYEGSIKDSILSSLKNIVSCLLGVINVFSDIVSYIRLWAVGLAGAAISATVNEMASPLIGDFLFTIFAIFILVFGHGLNMILNVLSVIVHGVRLNTLEFSSHLDMSWGGHKFEPFEE